MKKSNKVSVFYIISSLGLFVTLLLGGVYGMYVSIGLSFVRSSMSNITDVGGNGISNVSFGGSVNFAPSMTGVIILSALLVVIAIIDFINLIKQIIFFKQYKLVKNSKFEKGVERKVKSKGSVIFWTILIDLISFAAGVAGIFINSRSFARGNNMAWIFYAVDALVSILALLSFILLIVKLKNRKNETRNFHRSRPNNFDQFGQNIKPREIDQMEYNLIKLNAMKSNKIISDTEFRHLRKRVLSADEENFFENNKTDY